MLARGSATLPPPTWLLGTADRNAPASPLSPKLNQQQAETPPVDADAEKFSSGRGFLRGAEEGLERMRVFLKN
jgi:hypothetical protein